MMETGDEEVERGGGGTAGNWLAMGVTQTGSRSVVNLVFFLHPRRRVVGKVALVAEGEAFPVDSP